MALDSRVANKEVSLHEPLNSDGIHVAGIQTPLIKVHMAKCKHNLKDCKSDGFHCSESRRPIVPRVPIPKNETFLNTLRSSRAQRTKITSHYKGNRSIEEKHDLIQGGNSSSKRQNPILPLEKSNLDAPREQILHVIEKINGGGVAFEKALDTTKESDPTESDSPPMYKEQLFITNSSDRSLQTFYFQSTASTSGSTTKPSSIS